MTFYFAAGEMSGFIPSDATTSDSTTAGRFNSSFARGAVLCGAGSASQYGESAAISLPDEFYVHFDLNRATSSPTTTTGLALSAAGTDVFRIQTNNTTLQMQVLLLGVWTNVGTAVSYDGTTLQTIDLYIDGNSATGTAKLYIAGTLRLTVASTDLSPVASITAVRSYGINTASGHNISQVIIADEPTIGMRLATYYPSGAGATGDWTGDYTSVDEAVLNDADFIYSGTNGQVELFTGTGPALTGYVVRAVGVYARAKKGASGPSNLQLAIRVNGTTYTSSSKALDVGYSAYGNIWSQNPDTTADWLVSQISSVQFGVKAVT